MPCPGMDEESGAERLALLAGGELALAAEASDVLKKINKHNFFEKFLNSERFRKTL